LAALNYRRGNLMLAEAFYWWALHLKEQILGPDHPETAMTLNNLAVLFRSQGKLNEAGPLFRRALTILENTLDPDHPSVLLCRTNYEELQQEFPGE
ncbi:MAG: tetratricopeptide repeat protein, partial [Acidobacteriia bacterium]|nr:tetratricopeptide repeat protein [Terriglobia bacterium]